MSRNDNNLPSLFCQVSEVADRRISGADVRKPDIYMATFQGTF
jgi:hypothetical protein